MERVGDETAYKHNIHSRERFYTPEESIEIMKNLQEKYGKPEEASAAGGLHG